MNRIAVISLLLVDIAIAVCAAQAENGKAEKVTYQVLLSEHEIRFEHRIQLQHCFSRNIDFAVVSIIPQVCMLSSYDEKTGHNTYYSDDAE